MVPKGTAAAPSCPGSAVDGGGSVSSPGGGSCLQPRHLRARPLGAVAQAVLDTGMPIQGRLTIFLCFLKRDWKGHFCLIYKDAIRARRQSSHLLTNGETQQPKWILFSRKLAIPATHMALSPIPQETVAQTRGYMRGVYCGGLLRSTPAATRE